jgi:hypothetical protein
MSSAWFEPPPTITELSLFSSCLKASDLAFLPNLRKLYAVTAAGNLSAQIAAILLRLEMNEDDLVRDDLKGAKPPRVLGIWAKLTLWSRRSSRRRDHASAKLTTA